jgi:hypothetical protein
MTWRLSSGRNLRWVFMTRSLLPPFVAQDPVEYSNTFCPTQEGVNPFDFLQIP